MTIRLNRAFAALLAIVLACLFLMPATAFAEERTVAMENHTVGQSQKTIVSDICIGDVDSPEAGKQLDN